MFRKMLVNVVPVSVAEERVKYLLMLFQFII